jgi:hypothetical protein
MARPLERRSRLAPTLGVFLVLTSCVLAGAILRLTPVRRAGGVEFDFDPAFHFRQVEAVVQSGGVPAVDPLGLPPAGKPVVALLPTLLYTAVGGWHHFLARIGLTHDLTVSALSFIALCGGLIAVPVYAGARGLGLSMVAAVIAAIFAVLCPAHVHRTVGHWLRYDALGTLLVTAHVAGLAAALGARKGRGLVVGSAVAALALAAAIASWRVALVLVALESLVGLGAFLIRRLRPPLIIAFAPSLALALATSLVVPYLLTGPFLLSRTGALAFLTLGLLLLDAATALHARRGRLAWIARASLVAAILATSVGLGRESAYDSLGGAIATKLGAERHDIGAVLLATNAEMETPRPAHLFDADYFSAIGPFAILYALGRRFPRRRPLIAAPTAGRAGAGLALWHGATLVFFLLTLLFARHKVLAGPLLALYPGLVVDGVFRARPGRRLLRLAAAASVAAGLAWTAHDAVRLVRVLPARLAPELRAALAWLKAEARPGDVVLGDWGRGYVIQLAAGLPTVTDGLLELPEMRRRIGAFATALYAEEEGPLVALCHEHGARYLWVSAEKRGVNAAYAGLAASDYFHGGQPTARGWRTNYVRLLARPESFRGISPRFAAGPDRIFEIVDTNSSH